MTGKSVKFKVRDDHRFERADGEKISTVQPGSLFQRYKGEKEKQNKPTDTQPKNLSNTSASAEAPRSADHSVSSKPETSMSGGKSIQSDNIATGGSNSSESSTTLHAGATFAETFSYLKDTAHYTAPPEQPQKAGVDDSLPKYRSNSIIVNPRQRGNPILKFVKNVPWEFGDIVPDYQLGQTQCALFLSLRYYNFNPDYIHERLKQLGNRFDLRVLLVLVDIRDCQHALRELGKMAILSDCTLVLSWSPEEAGRYLETYKAYENKPSDVIQERVDGDYLSKMTDCLTSVKSVNKTDVITLLSTFGSLDNITNATVDDVALCPGFGLQKAQRLHRLFREPFKKRKRKSEPTDQEEPSPKK